MENESKGLAIATLVLGIISVFSCGCCFPLGILAIIFAIIVLAKKKGGKPMAIIGMILSFISIMFVVLTYILFIPLKSSFTDFMANSDTYIEEYEEDGTYPEFVEQFADMMKLSGEERENFEKQFMESFKQGYQNQ